jgi:HPt (histidine-containing phosphotransfer) domain-containing protein
MIEFADMFDRPRLLEQFGGDIAFLAEVLGLFFETEVPASLKVLRQAVASGDHAQVKRTAHTLRGALMNFHAARAVEAAGALEASVAAGGSGMEAALGELEAVLAKLETALQDEFWRQGGRE